MVVGLALAACQLCPAQAPSPRDLTQYSLEQLMNLPVTSVSAKEQKLLRTPAAVYVITAEDIRRSGATTIPELLRLAPGVTVEQIDANAWSIGIRGFADWYANKVLVLVDGRSVYNPAFSGVVWDALHVPLEDIERIEVIRGPGGTVWGANAVNGVVNIITKSAAATEGGLLTASAGSELKADTLLRYGGKLGRKGAYRVFGRYFNRNPSEAVGGGPAKDESYASHGGFRTDWTLSDRDSFSAEGDFQRTLAWQTLPVVFENALPATATLNDRIGMTTASVLGRWTHTLLNGSEMSWQVYDDSFRRAEQGVRYSHNIVDIGFQHHLAWGSRHDIVWGAEARIAATRFCRGYALAINPERKTDPLFSAFLQDEFRLGGSVWLTAGSKFEHNAYTGFEFEPSAQLLWTLTPKQAIWTSAARAIRQPSRIDSGILYDVAVIPGNPFLVTQTTGNPKIRAERLNDFEAGYRGQLTPRLNLDLTVFSGFYRDLEVSIPQKPIFTANPGPPHLVLPVQFENGTRAHSYGTEIFLNSNITNRWRLSPGYSMIHVSAKLDAGIPSAGVQVLRGHAPEHQFQFRSFLNLPHRLEWDHTLAYVGAVQNGYVPRYVRLDTRLGWPVGESVELSVTGKNLLQPRHLEFPNEYGLDRTQIERSVYAKITWWF